MARLPRLCVAGWPHLLLQQARSGQPVFKDDDDRQLYRSLLQQSAGQHGVQIHSYSLRDDGVLLLATPAGAEGLSGLVQSIGRRYVAQFNRRHGHQGSLWAGRFRATPIEPERYLLDCMRYVEGLALLPHGDTGLPWSSAEHHLGRARDAVVSDHLLYWSLGNTPFERELAYASLCKQALTTHEFGHIHDALKKGWPLGGERFMAELGQGTARRLTPLSKGRPRRRVAD